MLAAARVVTACSFALLMQMYVYINSPTMYLQGQSPTCGGHEQFHSNLGQTDVQCIPPAPSFDLLSPASHRPSGVLCTVLTQILCQLIIAFMWVLQTNLEAR